MNLNMEKIRGNDNKRGKLFYISTSNSDDQQDNSSLETKNNNNISNKNLSDNDDQDDSSWSEYSDSQDEDQPQPLSFEKLPRRSMSAAGGFTYYLSNNSIYPSYEKLGLLSTMFSNSQQNLQSNNNLQNSNLNRRLPPAPPPNELDSDSDDDDYQSKPLEFDAANKRLESLALKHNSSKSNSDSMARSVSDKGAPMSAITNGNNKSSNSSSNSNIKPQDISYSSTLVGSDDDPPMIARPQSPRTARRNMLASELSESLRKNLLWERETRARMLLGGQNNSSGMLAAKLRDRSIKQKQLQQQLESENDLAETEELEAAAELARIRGSAISGTNHRRYKSTSDERKYPISSSNNANLAKLFSTTQMTRYEDELPTLNGNARNYTENDLQKYNNDRRKRRNRYLSSSPDYHG